MQEQLSRLVTTAVILLAILASSISVGQAQRNFKDSESRDTTQTPNWESEQIYLRAAPYGVGAEEVWGVAGGTGSRVTVVVLEGGCINVLHEDIQTTDIRFVLESGRATHADGSTGIIAADSNTFGMTGIAYDASIGAISTSVAALPAAIAMAVDSTEVGDIITISMQISHIEKATAVPVENDSAVFAAIKAATDAGWILVEAAGNGGGSLDQRPCCADIYHKHSGAIMVGSSNLNHTRFGSSNFGERVDMHAYGHGVYSLGYGVLYGTDTVDFSDYYTGAYGQTSAATPQVAGACAVVQSVSKAVLGHTMDHNEMRAILKQHSTPQAQATDHIGPMPNVEGAVNEILGGVTFTVDSWFGTAPFEAGFTAFTNQLATSWLWDFGDGHTSTAQSPVHEYDLDGTYNVTLTAVIGQDTSTVTRTAFIEAFRDTLIDFTADTSLGPAPLKVSFDGWADATLPTDAWIWDFGDGDSAFVENPVHVYEEPGIYAVKLQVGTGDIAHSIIESDYIAVYADTMIVSGVDVMQPRPVEVPVYFRNTLPVEEIYVPVRWFGPLSCSFDSFSTVGCRTGYFGNQQPIHSDMAGQCTTILLSTEPGQPDLLPDTGTVLKLYFTIPYSAVEGQIDTIDISGYSSRLPLFVSIGNSHQVETVSGEVAYVDCLGIRGNVDGDPSELVNVLDLLYLRDFMFYGGPPPPSMIEANVDGDVAEEINIMDLIYLNDYIFNSGPAPPSCP
jgi:hypothetical protein